MSQRRFFVIKVIVIAMLIALIWRLYDMQIINGMGYKNLSNQRISANITVEAPRGEITDRNGKVLVTNRKGYSIKLQKTDLSDVELNIMLLKLFSILESEGGYYEDSLPVSMEAPYSFTIQGEELEKWFSERKTVSSGMTAEEVVESYRKAYEVPDDFSEKDRRKVTGIRYDMNISGFSRTTPYHLSADISSVIISKIKENQDQFPGVAVTEEFLREYPCGTVAAHILGRVGKIYQEEYEELSEKGYKMNDLVGKQGIEKICEEYLKGIDGSKNVYHGADADLIGMENEIDAVPGNYVVTTIDYDLQKVAEESLARHIAQIAEDGKDKEKRGAEADAGAAVVIDVKTGDTLALATYPTYNPQTFNSDYNMLLQDPAKPLWNRAVSGTYTPGSTFKPLTAMAALSAGAIGVNEKIPCDGVYTYYQDYQPKCWIWAEQRKTHDLINVSDAIKNSCNCFFYETGRRVGIDAIDKFAKDVGLGEKTGIELLEEVSGNVSGPEYKKTLFADPDDQRWVPGDVIQTAIGQSFTSVTPIGLANYTATIANGGTRYRTRIIKSIHSTTNGSLVYENKPVVSGVLDISEENLAAVKAGMLGVTDEGSASAIFHDYPVSIGGKTGTAQISKNVSNNALFVAFAPFEKPEIAVCVVIEHGYRGANAAYVARDIFDEYFGIGGESEEPTDPNQYQNSGIISELLP
ncbi:MAG: hypothetical protein E7417_01410 [Ruminococcaceae bacterium]|nr:hypothetical protein [Oscillospiraceae bacterium]